MRPAPPIVNRALGVVPGRRRPLFVCGHERSGTTWMAATLGQAPGVLWYNEPAHWQGDVDAFPQQAAHLPVDVASPYFEAKLDPAFAGLLIEARRWSVRSPRSLRRLLAGHRVLVKEVSTYMSIEWVARRYRPDVLIPLRHPCPVVLSQLERGMWARGWLDEMLRNDRLMADHLAPYRSLMEQVIDPLETTAVLWAARTRVVADQRPRHPEWRTVAYEDLARDPVRRFRSLYASLGLRWTSGVERYVAETTTTPSDERYGTVRVSADHADRWRASMDDGDVARVRRMVEPFDLPWYRADRGAYA